MTMFAEPILASSAEERMERAGMDCRTRDYGHHYPGHSGGHTGHGDTPDHLRDKSYHYSDNDDREVGDKVMIHLWVRVRIRHKVITDIGDSKNILILRVS